ncbi:FAD-dependent monooxygenase [Ramlibacter sp.]|uniref:FAD-dependent monooxygenase n=1 Tax=Ramlibacter sp. TaxID=1917967 RepID=UPI002CFFE8AB|nr:FAD-dependent monooxygenase [Ramlibacter sp.]HWI81268.1 FAD-dependent monooxygenase [Ramlibacter sp.]
MTNQVLVAGGGLGGLAAGLASVRAGWDARLYERTEALREVGAGIQLGPNATRILIGWGLQAPLLDVAAQPQQLHVRDGVGGAEVGTLALGAAFARRYGAPYLTVHRADLQSVLAQGAQRAGVQLRLASRVAAVQPGTGRVRIGVGESREEEGAVLVGADGLWSEVRRQVCDDGPPRITGHLAYRTVALQRDLPAAVRSQDVTVWLGPRMHVVAYPVRAGEFLNVVAIVQGRSAGPVQEWDQAGAVADLMAAMGPLCRPLQQLVAAMPGWRLWALQDRPPLRSASQMASGRIALLGDAAHPMRPYLAQGAGMAIEDAAELGRLLAGVKDQPEQVPAALRTYAENRWQRCARVQARAERNGRIFHATGLVRWGRDLSLRLLGERLLDQPWLYGR